MSISNESSYTQSVETMLPYGEKLRPLIVSSLLSKNDLKKMLSKKGIFISGSEKEITIPLLTKCIISPKEFEFIRDNQKSKEDSIKKTTQTISWDSDKPLVEAINSNEIPFRDLISERISNYDLLGASNIIAENENELIVEYQIERTDRTKDWASYKSNHEGKITFKKSNDGKQLEVSMEHTAIETKNLNNKIVQHLVKEFKENGYILGNRHIQKIKYGDFTNKNRIQFLMSFHAQDDLNILFFKEVTNVEFGPDENKKLPTNIKWMEDKVKNLIMKGNRLHDMDILKEHEYHDTLIFEEIEASYDFRYSAAAGNCTVSYGFPSYLRSLDQNTEFEMKISRISLASQYAGISKKEVEKKLLSMFAAIKMKKYEKFKN